MAISRFSTPFQVTQPISPVDIQLLDNTLGYKQAKYDEGYLAISKSLQAYNSLDLIRPEDIEYKNRKVEALTEQLNSYGSVDLSDPKEVIKLQMNAASLAEDKDLIGRVQSTKNYRQLVDRYAKMKENPKLMPYYSDVNEMEDMEQANNWLTGKTTNFSKSSPTLFTDPDKVAGDLMKQVKPTTYSYVNGLSRVNGEITSEGDLKNIAINLANTNGNVQAQLMRNAKAVFRNQTPQQIYSTGLQNITDDISTNQQSIISYENQLKSNELSKEEKASLEGKINQLKNSINSAQQEYSNLANEYSRGEFSNIENLKYRSYLTTWADSVTKPYTVRREKITGDMEQITRFKEQSKFAAEDLRMKFDADQKRLDREASFQNNLLDAKIGAAKIGQTIDENYLRETGEVRFKTDGTALGNAYVDLPVLQENNEIDAFADITNQSNKYRNANKALVSQVTQKVLEKTDRELLAKIQPLLNDGNLFDNKTGKYLGNSFPSSFFSIISTNTLSVLGIIPATTILNGLILSL